MDVEPDMDAESDVDGEHVCSVCGEPFETASALHRHVHDVGLID